MKVKAFFDERTWTVSYVVWDEDTRDAVVIDPVLDYNPIGSKVWTESVDELESFIKGDKLTLHYILETHAHADHLTGSQVLNERFPSAKIAIGSRITVVQELFKDVFELDALATDGSQFDLLIEDGQTIEAGSLAIKAIFTPGHTPACASYVIEDAVFTGDALFMPDMGTGRADFPAGSAEDLYESVQKLYALPEETRVFVGHDYGPGGRAYDWQSTIGEEKARNVQLKAETERDQYIAFRRERDQQLSAPKLLYQSVQVNIDAGHLPEKFLKIPLNKK